MNMNPGFDTPKQQNRIVSWIKRHKFMILGFFLVLLVLSIVSYTYVGKPVLALRTDAIRLQQTQKNIQKALNEKKFEQLEREVSSLRDQHEQIVQDYAAFSYVGSIPILNSYYADGEHLLGIAARGITVAEATVEALEPHRVLLGFDTDEVINTEQQIIRIAQITPQLIPVLDIVGVELAAINEELGQIDISKYPVEFRGVRLHDQYNEIHMETIPFVQELIVNIKPILPEIPTAMGSVEPVRYLFLFQNDKEIRPTGGFITAYAVAEFNAGAFRIVDSGNIYDVDPEIPLAPVPDPIVVYLRQKRLNMRDSNFSPDYQVSMETLSQYYPYTGLPAVQGIIALDTHFLESILAQTGPVNVEQYSLDFSAYPNLPDSCQVGGTEFTAENVVCRLELYSQQILRGTGDRKRILGDLMDEIVSKVLSTPAREFPILTGVIFKELDEKHMLVNLDNQKLQSFVEDYNWGGRIHETRENVDYLHVNDANLAGLKSDLYLVRTVSQEHWVDESGATMKKVTLSYTNTGEQDGWLNAVARNYVRVYVPQGSELVSFTGDTTRDAGVYDDLNKTVFDNFILIPPLATSTVEIVYKLPFGFADTYIVDIQKQPGKDAVVHTVNAGGSGETMDIRVDTTVELPL